MGVTFVIVEVSGRKIEDCKLLGDHPTAEDYSIYIRWTGSVVRADRSDTDECLASEPLRDSKIKAFGALMGQLAELYDATVTVECDYGVSGGQSSKLTGTWERVSTAAELAEAESPVTVGMTQVTLVADPKPYAPHVRRSAEVFELSGNAEIGGWQGRVRNRHHDHVIVDFGYTGEGPGCCEHADKLGRHMHMQPQVIVISAHRIGPAPVRREARIGDVITVDGSDWRIVNAYNLHDPYLLPA